MSFLFVTADKIGTPTGGGAVTCHESQALATLGQVGLISREELEMVVKRDRIEAQDPWQWDIAASSCEFNNVPLAHFYAGTFGRTVEKLKSLGAKVTYTVAAHDKEESRKEHERFGIDFQHLYPHLCHKWLWEKYVRGYQLADVIICPSRKAAEVVRSYPYDGRIEVIPHGCYLPTEVKPLPNKFTVGYLGAYGPDKGVIYLLQAWKKLDYKDATLVLAGRDSTSPYVADMVRRYGGGNVWLRGWMESAEEFYSQLSLYIQPSRTEGFGIEVVEAMASGRPVLCSKGAGAADLLRHRYYAPDAYLFDACDVDGLMEKIQWMKTQADLETLGRDNRVQAKRHTWDLVRQRYVDLWRSLL